MALHAEDHLRRQRLTEGRIDLAKGRSPWPPFLRRRRSGLVGSEEGIVALTQSGRDAVIASRAYLGVAASSHSAKAAVRNFL